MRVAQLALLIICIQVAGLIVSYSGVFGVSCYERALIPTNANITNPEALSSTEQQITAVNIINIIFNTLTWSWIKCYFMPIYHIAEVRTLIDLLVLGFNSVSTIIIFAGALQFMRNLIRVF